MTVVTDDFNRADGAIGAAWTNVPTGDGTPTWSIVSNMAQNVTTGGSFGKYCRHDSSVGSDDMYTEFDTNSTQVNASTNTGVMVRGQTGATNTSIQFSTNINSDAIGFWQISAGVETQQRLAGNTAAGTSSFTRTSAIAAGDRLRCEVIGNLVRGLINGVLRAVTLTTIATGSRGGINGYHNAAGDLTRVDNFEAGALTDDPPPAPYIAGMSAQVSGVGTTLTPTVPANILAGDLVIAHCTSRDAAQTMTAPGSEGWSASLQTPTQTGLEDAVFAKVWGSGATDDTTPTFSIGAGTAGWGVTLTIWRNPQHATLPWTTVASVVVGSGSQSNAASATATAPSVSIAADDATVVRLFSSADDNQLGISTTNTTHSEGALVYGGLAYSSTQGNDLAQACSVLENTDIASSTGTATVTETINGNDANNGITLVLAIPTAAPVAAIGEVDTLAAATRSGEQTASVLVEADTLAAVSRSGSQVAILITETDTLLPVAHTHAPLIGALAEIDTLAAVQHSTSRAAAALGEADTLADVQRSSSMLVASLGEVDTLFPATRAASQLVVALSELDTLHPLDPVIVVGAIGEVDQLLAVGHQTTTLVAALSEIDTLLGVSGGASPTTTVLVWTGGSWRAAIVLVAAGNSWLSASIVA